MISIDCPSCQKPMGIDENDLSSEWECPNCATAFRVQKNDDGPLQFQITSPPAEPTAIRAKPARNHRRRRPNHALIEAGAEDPNLDIRLPVQSPLQARFTDLEPAQPRRCLRSTASAPRCTDREILMQRRERT